MLTEIPKNDDIMASGRKVADICVTSATKEILGGILMQLILCTAVNGRMGPYPVVTKDWDNDGILKCGNKPSHPLSGSGSC